MWAIGIDSDVLINRGASCGAMRFARCVSSVSRVSLYSFFCAHSLTNRKSQIFRSASRRYTTENSAAQTTAFLSLFIAETQGRRENCMEQAAHRKKRKIKTNSSARVCVSPIKHVRRYWAQAIPLGAEHGFSPSNRHFWLPIHKPAVAIATIF